MNIGCNSIKICTKFKQNQIKKGNLHIYYFNKYKIRSFLHLLYVPSGYCFACHMKDYGSWIYKITHLDCDASSSAIGEYLIPTTCSLSIISVIAEEQIYLYFRCRTMLGHSR